MSEEINSHKETIIDKQQIQQKIKIQCIICERTEESGRKFMPLFTDREHICMDCYAQQNQQLVIYKNGRPKMYPDLDEILEGLWLGNEDAAMDEQIIVGKKIRAICACGSMLMAPYEKQKFEEGFQNMEYRKHDIADFPTQKILHLFDDNNKWLDEMLNNGRVVLVHCAAGVSRSASFIIAYLMYRKKISFNEAFEYTKSKRGIIRPNSGFINQLKQYEEILKNKNQ